MPLTKLKAVEQTTWLRSGGGPEAGGVCYYMCNYIESDKGIWNKPDSFANASTLASNFAQGTAMMNYAKAQSLRKARQAGYAAVAGALANNRIYRVGVWIGNPGAVVGAPNHEIIIVTGAGDDIIYFEPNFGFFQASNPGSNNRQAFEYHVNQQYVALGKQTGAFDYLNVRALTAATPKGFTA